MAPPDSNNGASDMVIKRLDEAKKQRKLLRSLVTKSINEIDKIFSTPDPHLGRLIVKTLENIDAKLSEQNATMQESLDDDALSRDEDECFESHITITDKIETTRLIKPALT